MTSDEQREKAIGKLFGSPGGRGGDQLEGNMSMAPEGAFVDRIDGDVAVVLMPGGETSEIPVNQLPPGVKEGEYLSPGGKDEAAYGTALRNKLMQGDDGGNIKL